MKHPYRADRERWQVLMWGEIKRRLDDGILTEEDADVLRRMIVSGQFIAVDDMVSVETPMGRVLIEHERRARAQTDASFSRLCRRHRMRFGRVDHVSAGMFERIVRWDTAGYGVARIWCP